jgi:amino acid transporter
MKRVIPTTSLIFTSISAIMGSGWLFSAFYTAQIAGPAALLSWGIGAFLVLIIAFVFAELSAMLPVSGSSTRIPQVTHGSVVSFVFSWMVWVSYVALMVAEVQAVMLYLNYLYPKLVNVSGNLDLRGLGLSAVLMLLISILNTYSLRWLLRCNNVLTVLKVIIPVVIVIVVCMFYFSPARVLHPAHSAFAPFGKHGILGALTTGGIIFAFNGFKQAAEMAGEAKNPGRSVPLAIILSIVICAIIFILLQSAFLSSINAGNLTHGWHHLNLGSGSSPLASILKQDHLSVLMPLLLFGAIISPFAAGMMYCGSASRSLYGMSKNGYLPKFFQHLGAHGSPFYAIGLNFLMGLCLFAPLPGWNHVVAFLTSLLALTYGIGPISLVVLRKSMPNLKRPFKLPLAWLWSYIAFYICTLLTYWSGWDILSKTSLALLFGLVILLTSSFAKSAPPLRSLNWRQSWWLWFYFVGIAAFSYTGNYGHGLGLFSDTWVSVAIAIFCLVIFIFAISCKLPASTTKKHIDDFKLTTTED